MSEILFVSVFGDKLKDFISLNQFLGKEYENGIYLARQLDKFAQHEISCCVTREFSDRWCQLRDHESEYCRYSRVSFLVRFANFLLDNGIHSYVPLRPKKPPTTLIPYIYTRDEIKRLFKASDNLKLGRLYKESCLIAFPAILRLQYATGLRIGETLSLKHKDIDFNRRSIRIEKSKNGRERCIPFSESVLNVLEQYLQFREKLKINYIPEYFFTKLNGHQCGQQEIREYFKVTLHLAGILSCGKGQGPRIHDLRHTFAVHSIATMIHDGRDPEYCLPYLSEYMGHQTSQATDGYIRLTMDLFPELKDLFNSIDIFPNYRSNEGI